MHSRYEITTTSIIENRYGWHACQEFDDSRCTWEEIWNFVKNYQPHEEAEVVIEDEPAVAIGAPPSAKGRGKGTGKGKSTTSEPSTSSADRQARPSLPIGAPPAHLLRPPPPPAAVIPPPPPAVLPAQQMAMPQQHQQQQVQQQPTHQMPIGAWKTTMIDKGIDEYAFGELELLSQRGEHGLAQAQVIMANFLQSNFSIRNPSAWVHRAVGFHSDELQS
jgi:hypothetical protein